MLRALRPPSGRGSRVTQSQRYQAGDRIVGKYELVRKLDEGGMGAVWAARNVDLDVHIALKLLKPELLATHAVERLLSEARMLARLQHPAIVRVHDCGTTDEGVPFVAMELLDGETLADQMARRGRISAIEAVSLLLPVIDGVRVAHQAGIVHRDIKPENIFLSHGSGRMQPKLLDFGIALAEAFAARRTTQGAIMGSPVYMSPEQARGNEVDSGTDLWALSVVLFELMSGKLPFNGDNYNAVLRAIIEEESPSLTELCCGDELLAAIVERGLRKDPRSRWQTAKDFGTALAEWLLGQGVSEDACHVSLRAGWLTHASEPPVSLRPMVVGGSEPPPADGAQTLVPERVSQRAARLGDSVGSSDTRRSVTGMSLTSSQSRRSGRRLWLAGAAACAVVAAGSAHYFSTHPPAPSSSAPAVELSAPIEETTRRAPPDELSPSDKDREKVTEEPAREEVPATDAGANSGPDSEKTPATSAPSQNKLRPAKPTPERFRPRGI